MKKSRLPLLLIVVSLVGCQSAPRFAWWKSDSAATENSSLIARSAPTVAPSASQTAGLPSESVQPQTMAARTAPAQTQPGATQVAGVPQIPAVSVPSGSNGTLSSAPVANYQVAAPPSAAASNYTVPSSTTAVAATTPTTNSVGTTVPVTAGPYDPSRYQSQAPTVAATVPAAAPVANRYASAPAVAPVANRYGASGAGRYGSSPAVATPAAVSPTDVAPSAARYAATPAPSTLTTTPVAAPVAGTPIVAVPAPLAETNGTIPTTTPAPVVAAATPYVNPLREQVAASMTAANGTAVNGAVQNGVSQVGQAVDQAAAQATAGTVNLVSTAGQYRPGGTSTYPSGQINIATRPSSTVGAPATTTPATGSRY